MPDGTPDSMANLRGDLASTAAALVAELEGLGRIIADARAEVAALRLDDTADDFIPTATDELAAIVDHTAKATHEIIDTCEQLERMADEAPQLAERIGVATTRIYEACAFQDITGQRIAKVVTALQAIEARIGRARNGLIPRLPAATALPEKTSDEKLLNGPQLPGAGISQSDIDALFD
jgi:chemotaxis protein CheZ